MQTFNVQLILPFETREMTVRAEKMIGALITSLQQLGHAESKQQVSSDGVFAEAKPECDIATISCIETNKTRVVVNACLYNNGLYYDYSYNVYQLN